MKGGTRHRCSKVSFVILCTSVLLSVRTLLRWVYPDQIWVDTAPDALQRLEKYVAEQLHQETIEASYIGKALSAETANNENLTLSVRTDNSNVETPRPASQVLSKEGSSDLVVIAGARLQYIELIRYNIQNHFNDWDCVVYVYEQDVFTAATDRLGKLCSIHLKPNKLWGDYLYMVTPDLTSKYNHIAVLLDDVYLPAVGPKKMNMPLLLRRMEWLKLGVYTPTVAGTTRGSEKILQKEDKCIFQTTDIELFVTVYTHEAWACLWGIMEPDNHSGWCLDVCYPKFCSKHKQAIDTTMLAYHLPHMRPPKHGTDFYTVEIDTVDTGGSSGTRRSTLAKAIGKTDARVSYTGDMSMCNEKKCPWFDRTSRWPRLWCTDRDIKHKH